MSAAKDVMKDKPYAWLGALTERMNRVFPGKSEVPWYAYGLGSYTPGAAEQTEKDMLYAAWEAALKAGAK